MELQTNNRLTLLAQQRMAKWTDPTALYVVFSVVDPRKGINRILVKLGGDRVVASCTLPPALAKFAQADCRWLTRRLQQDRS